MAFVHSSGLRMPTASWMLFPLPDGLLNRYLPKKKSMSELHDILWSICRKLPTDFEPFGQRDRDTAEPGEDCSCGCVHFMKLSGGLGRDWGVCANPKSPRAGLLTFEHQGCPEFQDFAAIQDAIRPEPENAPVVPRAKAEGQPEPGRKLKVKFYDIQQALEGLDSVDGVPVHHFLDTETGEVFGLCREWPDYEEMSERVEDGYGGRCLRIERMESHKSFEIMENFANRVAQPAIKQRLMDALRRPKPFRGFGNAVHSDLTLRNEWFKFRDAAQADYIRDLLRENGIAVELEKH